MLLRDLGLASETADQKDAGVAWMLPDIAPQERLKGMQLVCDRKYTAQD